MATSGRLGIRPTQGAGAAHLEIYTSDPTRPFITARQLSAALTPLFNANETVGIVSATLRRQLRKEYEILRVTKRRVHQLARQVMTDRLARLPPIGRGTPAVPKAGRARTEALLAAAAKAERDSRGITFWVWLWKVSMKGRPETAQIILGQKASGIAFASPRASPTVRSVFRLTRTTTPSGQRAIALKSGNVYVTANAVRRELRNWAKNQNKNWVNSNASQATYRGALRNVYNKLDVTSTYLHRLADAVLRERISAHRAHALKAELELAKRKERTRPEFRNQLSLDISKEDLTHYGETLFWAWLWNVTKLSSEAKRSPVQIVKNRLEGRHPTWLAAVNAKWRQNAGLPARQVPNAWNN